MITCTEENTAEFRAELRKNPGLHAFAAALYEAGLIDGLRDMSIAHAPDALPERPGAVVPVLPYAGEVRHLDREWTEQQQKGAR
jgi:hypothetical protein